jgi:hypothetical protein
MLFLQPPALSIDRIASLSSCEHPVFAAGSFPAFPPLHARPSPQAPACAGHRARPRIQDPHDWIRDWFDYSFEVTTRATGPLVMPFDEVVPEGEF